MKMFSHIQVIFPWRLLAFLCTFREVESKPTYTTTIHVRRLRIFDANEGISNQIGRSSLLRPNGGHMSENRQSTHWKKDEDI